MQKDPRVYSESLKEDPEYDQMTLKEYIDPFTGEPVKQDKK
jgi:putative transposase